MKRRTFTLLCAAGLTGCLENNDGAAPSPTTESTQQTETSTKTPQSTQTTAPQPTQTTAPPTTSESESAPTTAMVDGVAAQKQAVSLREVSFEERPTVFVNQWDEPQCRVDASKVHTLPNLQMATINGERGHMPVRTSRSILKMLYCYRQLEREQYLNKATEIATAYLDTATRTDGALYFPYTMKKGGAGVTLTPPWYSALAQGTSLSAYLRLHETTGNTEYRKRADAVYESFRRIKRNAAGGPWTAMVDEEGYLWFEEYPHDPPTHVLNGFLTGLWGVYEYWLLTKRTDSRTLLEAAITTIKRYAKEFRVPGEVSWYALNHGYRGNELYHAIHILQLRKLHQITGDPYFKELSEMFDQDHPETAGMKK